MGASIVMGNPWSDPDPYFSRKVDSLLGSRDAGGVAEAGPSWDGVIGGNCP